LSSSPGLFDDRARWPRMRSIANGWAHLGGPWSYHLNSIRSLTIALLVLRQHCAPLQSAERQPDVKDVLINLYQIAASISPCATSEITVSTRMLWKNDWVADAVSALLGRYWENHPNGTFHSRAIVWFLNLITFKWATVKNFHDESKSDTWRWPIKFSQSDVAFVESSEPQNFELSRNIFFEYIRIRYNRETLNWKMNSN
jgi:hypothetical protein